MYVRGLLWKQSGRFFVSQDDVLDRILLVLEVLCVVVGIGREEALCVEGYGLAAAIVCCLKWFRCTLIPVEALGGLDTGYLDGWLVSKPYKSFPCGQ